MQSWRTRLSHNLKLPGRSSTLISQMMRSILPNSRMHDLSFHASGKIDISARVARKLSLAPGDVIDIAREGGEWYLYVRLRSGCYAGRHRGRVFPTAKGGGTFRAWSKPMTDAVLSAAGADGLLRCPCGTEVEREETKYITIIYSCSL